MGTLTTGKIKAGALESSNSPAPNTHITFANTTITTYDSTTYTAGGQEMETFDFTENGLSTGEAFVYEKSGAGKLQGYPGLCLVSDQVDGSQVFADRGPSKISITAAGHAHHDSGGSTYLHNPTSIYFDGTGDYLALDDHENWMFGTGAFTIECWCNPHSSGLGQESKMLSRGVSTDYWTLGHNEGNTQGQMRWYASESSSTVADIKVTIGSTLWAWGVWHHVALVSTGGMSPVHTFFVDGKIIGTDQPTITNWDYGTNLTIGANVGRDVGSYQYMDDIRILKGVALYTKEFTPPSRSPKDTRAYGDVADYTKITMMGYRSDSSSYFTAINYVAGDEVVARDYMGIGYDDLKSVAYSGGTQKIMVYNNTTNTIKFTAYVEATT